MKNNEEFRASVFEKAAAYEAERAKKRGERIRRALAVGICTLIAVPAIYIPINFIAGDIATAGSAASTGKGAGTTLSTTVGTYETAGTPGALGTTNIEKTEVFETTTAAQTTTSQHTTTDVKTTEVLQTTSTTGTAGTTALPGNTAEVFIPDISLGDKIFCNGAFSYKTEYDSSVGYVKSEYYYYPYSFEKGSLREYAEGYIDVSESFFDHQALIVAKITVDRGTPVLARIDSGEGIDVSIRLIISEGEKVAPTTWIILIPVSKKIAKPSPERVRFYINEYHLD